MQVITKVYKSIKFSLLAVLLVFVLSPCAIKISFFTLGDISLSNTLTKTRALGQNICNNIGQAQNNILVTTTNKKTIKAYSSIRFFSTDRDKSDVNTRVTSPCLAEFYPANSPPKYILYKRLKVYLS